MVRGGRLAIPLLCIIAGSLLPSASAQLAAPPRIDLEVERQDALARVAPGATESMRVNVRVRMPEPSYCLDSLELRLSVRAPEYAHATVSPEKHPITLAEAGPSGPEHGYFVHSHLEVSLDPRAPALQVGEYEVRAVLARAGEGPTCNIPRSERSLEFGLVNDYVINTTARGIGWDPDLVSTYMIEVANHANGPTRFEVSPARYDPMAMGRLQARDLVLAPDMAGVMRVTFAAVSPGYHVAHLQVHARFDGPQEASRQSHNVTVETEADAPGSPATAVNTPSPGAGFAAVAVAGIAFWRRRKG